MPALALAWASAAQAQSAPHVLEPVVLERRSITRPVGLAVGPFSPEQVVQVTLTDAATGYRLDPAGAVQCANGCVPSGTGPDKAITLQIDGNQASPGRVSINLFAPEGKYLTSFLLPLAAPDPAVQSVDFVDRAGNVALHLTVDEARSRELGRVRVRGLDFRKGATIELPAPFEVVTDPVTSPTELTGVVRLQSPGLPMHAIPRGDVQLRVRNTEGGAHARTVQVRGPAPEIRLPVRAVDVAAGANSTVNLLVHNLADRSRVEILPFPGGRYTFEPTGFGLPDVTSETVSGSVYLPALPTLQDSARVRVVNADGTEDEAVLRLNRAASPTLKVTNPAIVYPGRPATITLAPEDASIRFQDARDAYTVRIDGTPVKLEHVVPALDGKSLQATLSLPTAFAPSVGPDVTRRIELHSPRLGASGLQGQLKVGAVPQVRTPKEVLLRPGESRSVPVSGEYLAGLELVSTDTVTVVKHELKERTGFLTLQASQYAAVGSTHQVVTPDGTEDGPVASLPVRIISWLSSEQLQEGGAYSVGGTAELHPLRPDRILEVDPDEPLSFWVEGPASQGGTTELVKGSISKDGQVIWQDSVFVQGDGTPARFNRTFRPEDGFSDGQEFALVLSAQGGAFVRQRFRLEYEREFLCDGCVGVLTGISAIQIPLGKDARREFQSGLFNGVSMGFSLPLDRVANAIDSDNVRLLIVLTASDPLKAPADSAATGAEPEGVATASRMAAGSALRQEEGEASDAATPLAYGIGTGVHLFNALMVVGGWDSRGDSFGEGFYVSIGGGIDMAKITQFLQRR